MRTMHSCERHMRTMHGHFYKTITILRMICGLGDFLCCMFLSRVDEKVQIYLFWPLKENKKYKKIRKKLRKWNYLDRKSGQIEKGGNEQENLEKAEASFSSDKTHIQRFFMRKSLSRAFFIVDSIQLTFFSSLISTYDIHSCLYVFSQEGFSLKLLEIKISLTQLVNFV